MGHDATKEYHTVRLPLDHEQVEARYYPSPGTLRGVVWIGGAGGGWDTPARDLYPRLSRQLTADGIASLRVRFRDSHALQSSVLDVLAGLCFLAGEGLQTLAIVGHSFGGAVAIEAATHSSVVRTVVTLASQSHGATNVGKLPANTSILLIHGEADRVLAPTNSERIYSLAHEPKRLVLYPGADHGLNAVANQVCTVVHDWLIDQLMVIRD